MVAMINTARVKAYKEDVTMSYIVTKFGRHTHAQALQACIQAHTHTCTHFI